MKQISFLRKTTSEFLKRMGRSSLKVSALLLLLLFFLLNFPGYWEANSLPADIQTPLCRIGFAAPISDNIGTKMSLLQGSRDYKSLLRGNSDYKSLLRENSNYKWLLQGNSDCKLLLRGGAEFIPIAETASRASFSSENSDTLQLAQVPTELYYYFSYLGKVRNLILSDYYRPATDETLVRGAVSSMRKVIPSIQNPPSYTWKNLESLYMSAAGQNLQKAGSLAEAAIDGMVNSLQDPYSVLLTPARIKLLQESDGSGIGVEMGYKNGRVFVIAPIVDGPADKAGIKSGDIIEAVNNKPVKGFTLYETSLMISGRSGERISITIVRNGRIMTFKPVFAPLNIKPIRYVLLSKNIGYIRIGIFTGKIYNEFVHALNQMKKRKVRGLIIDLRNNPGGDFMESLKMAARFVPNGALVWVQQRGKNPDPKQSGSNSTFPAPVVILINEGSASASEVFTAALAENGRAVTMGRKTFGKGLVQTEYKITDKTVIHLTTEQYLTPRKNNIHGIGIKPMIPLKQARQSSISTKDDFVIEAWKYLDGKAGSR